MLCILNLCTGQNFSHLQFFKIKGKCRPRVFYRKEVQVCSRQSFSYFVHMLQEDYLQVKVILAKQPICQIFSAILPPFALHVALFAAEISAFPNFSVILLKVLRE